MKKKKNDILLILILIGAAIGFGYEAYCSYVDNRLMQAAICALATVGEIVLAIVILVSLFKKKDSCEE